MSESHASPRPDQKGWFRGRSTCSVCKRSVCSYTMADGSVAVTDTETIAVVLDDKGKTIVRARRMHSETCAYWEGELKREQLRKEKADWERAQRRTNGGSGRTRGM